VLIYRLVTCNTVEEKIYRRQLLKGSLRWVTTPASSQPMPPLTLN
jgi:hypothetical protein